MTVWNIMEILRSVLKSILLGIPFIILTAVAMEAYQYNISDSSAPRGIYHLQVSNRPKVGDLVAMRMPMKTIAAVAGQHVRFSPEGVYVDGRLLPNSKPESNLVRRCPYGDYVVPFNMFLPMGTNNLDSFDGRYTCFETQNLIKGKAEPVITW